MDQAAERLLLRQQDGLSKVHHDAPPFAAAGGRIAIPRAAPRPRAERPTLSGMTLKNFAETLLKGPDFAQNEPLRTNTSQRSQVVDRHGPCVRNRRKSGTVENGAERIPPSPFGAEGRSERACFSNWLRSWLRSCSLPPTKGSESDLRMPRAKPLDVHPEQFLRESRDFADTLAARERPRREGSVGRRVQAPLERVPPNGTP
jgi:hypothetical protein